MIDVVEINAIEHLESIRLRWTSLFYQTRNATLFHTFDWLKLYWELRRDRESLRVLLVHRGGDVLGILPLVVRDELIGGRLESTLTYPSIFQTAECGPIGPNPTVTLHAACKYLARHRRGWNRLVLPTSNDVDYGRTANALRLADLLYHESQVKSLWQVDLNSATTVATSEAHCGLPAGIVFERHRLDLRNSNVQQNLEEVWDEVLSSNVLPFKGDKQSMISASLISDIVAVASQLEMLDLCLLRHAGHIIACSVNSSVNGIICQMCAAEDSNFDRIQPFSTLVSHMIVDGCRRHDTSLRLSDLPTELREQPYILRVDVKVLQHMPTVSTLARIAALLPSVCQPS